MWVIESFKGLGFFHASSSLLFNNLEFLPRSKIRFICAAKHQPHSRFIYRKKFLLKKTFFSIPISSELTTFAPSNYPIQFY